MSRYKTLRTWAAFLMGVGVISLIAASVGVVVWAVQADGFWDTMAVLLLGGPFVLLMSTWPLALGQALRAIADIGDAVNFEALSTTGQPRF